MTLSGNMVANAALVSSLGSVSGPTHGFSTDANTGMYSPGADQLGLTTGGVDAIRITSGQFVGINRTPTHRLDVSTGARVTDQIGFRINNSSSEGVYMVPYAGNGSYNNNAVLGDALIVSQSTNLTIGSTASAGFRMIGSTDIITTLGNLYVIGSNRKFGYDTGAGGTVTQLTSKSTGVTLDRATGQIVMNAATLNADATVSFTLTNSVISATDIVVLQHTSVGSSASYNLNAFPSAGSAVISVRNVTTGNLGQAIVLSFAVIRAVTS
jgi:hypothetical protein